jgi:hypothetical protein
MEREEVMIKPVGLALIIGIASSASVAIAEEATGASSSTEGAKVYFISPQEGDVVSGPVLVQFGLNGMGVAPAGVDKANTGHHHLVIDGELSPEGRPIPKSDTYRHFGGGQTETTLELAPGTHTLQLYLGDKSHTPHSPALSSDQITITVE